MINLSRMWFESEEDQAVDSDDESAEVVRSGDDLMLLPRRLAVLGMELVGEEDVSLDLMFEVLENIGDQEKIEAAAEEFARRIEQQAQAMAKAAERKGARLKAKHRERLERRPPRREVVLARKFRAPVLREGEVVGNVSARVDAGQVVNSVLSNTRREQGEIPFVLDAAEKVHTPDPADQATLEKLQLVASRSTGEDASTAAQGPGNWVVVKRSNPSLGVTFGIARPIGASLEEIRRTTGRNLVYGLVIVAVAMLGIFPLSARMTRNLSRLTEEAEELARGNLDARVAVRSQDEFGTLGRAFNQMAHDLSEHQRRLVKQERFAKELEMCRQIQDEMLPRARLSLPFAEVQALSIPAREVGGDFFNYFSLPSGDVALLMGDVSGKGLPAALLMANLQATLRARLPLESNLARLAGDLDHEIEDSTPVETYLTLFVGIVEAGERKLRFVNAGHNTQYLLTAGGEIERLESSGRPLGLMSGGGYTERSVELNDGDSLFLFTDGLTEAENAAGEPFSEGRLEALLQRERHNSPDEVLAHVEDAIRRHRGEAEISDDATMLVLKYEGSSLAS